MFRCGKAIGYLKAKLFEAINNVNGLLFEQVDIVHEDDILGYLEELLFDSILFLAQVGKLNDVQFFILS